MEAFFGTINEEMYRLKTYQSFEELATDINEYIAFYNTKRVTLSMGLRIPSQKNHVSWNIIHGKNKYFVYLSVYFTRVSSLSFWISFSFS